MNRETTLATATDHANKMYMLGLLHKSVFENDYKYIQKIIPELLIFLHAEYERHSVHHAVLRSLLENPT